MLRLRPRSRINLALERLDSRRPRAIGMQPKERVPGPWALEGLLPRQDPEDLVALLDEALVAPLRDLAWADRLLWDHLEWAHHPLWVVHLVRASEGPVWEAAWVCRLAPAWAVRKWAACRLGLG
mmetsp:Transcript_43230/g.104327  ORF Transcript_43230/g.104327 Transcript_43230/m.104327 type:complete len:124 (+) Transcript_43230:2425-2796(+)